MSCTVFKSTNTVDQSINVFPTVGYVSSVRIVRNQDIGNGDIFKFRNDNPKDFKLVGATLTAPSLGITLPITEGIINLSSEIIVKLDEGRDYAYLSWKDKDRILGFDSVDSLSFFGAYPDYSLGIHTEGATSINGICIKIGEFNQRVNSWDVSQVMDAGYCFTNAINFNREISWYAPNLSIMNNFLFGASKFDKDITIKGAKPTNMSSFLEGCFSFNSKINIDTSECTNFNNMLASAKKFNQPLTNFNFEKAVSMKSFLDNASTFNQPIDLGNTPNLVEADYMFSKSGMNSPIKFNAPNLKNASGWFSDNIVFNSTITGSFRSVVNMNWFFWGAKSFNKQISEWDIRNVLHFQDFLTGAISFNQDLSAWSAKFNVNANIAGVSAAPNWSTVNYDKYLNALWLDVGTTRQNEWTNGASTKTVRALAKRSAASQAAVSGLIGAGWTIMDGGLV